MRFLPDFLDPFIPISILLCIGLSETESEKMLQTVFQNSEQQLSYEEFSENFKQITEDKPL